MNKKIKDNFPPNESSSKSEPLKFSETWGKLITYCKSYFPAIIIAVVCAFGGTIFTLFGPDRLSEMTNIITEGLMGSIDLTGIRSIVFILIIFYAASFLLSYVQSFVMATVTQRVSKKLRTDISQKINRLPLNYFDKSSYGDILSRVTNDVDTIGQTLNQSIGNLIAAITMFVGSVIMMFATNWIMTLVAIGSSVIGFVFMILMVSRSQKYFTEQQELLGSINGHIEEVYAGHNVVKVYNANDSLQKEFNQYNKSLYSCNWKSQFISGLMMPLMNLISNLGYVAVCVAGAALAMNGTISFGVIVAFMVYVRLFTQPLTQIAQGATSLQSTGAASFRVFEFLGEEELVDESNKGEEVSLVKGNIEFRNVNFGYTKEQRIINNFSLKINAGSKVAIVGPTGAGKTTIVNLLMRFYEIDSGDILIDGISLKSLSRKNVHDLFCMVLQDTWLFEGTIRENIVYNKTLESDEQVVAACKAAGIHNFIKSLPNEYDTILNEEASFSSGQKQLITIARAMALNASMLILDEATSSVDTRTEILIQEAMDRLMEGRTSIVIAHRLSTIKNADLILVMKEGDIIEHGNHLELLEQKGFYADLYNSQFEKSL